MSLTPSDRGQGSTRNSADDGQQRVNVALDRGLRILAYLADHGGSNLTAISRDVGIPIATAHRILATLRMRGMAEFSEAAQKWFVGNQAFRIGNAYLSRSNVVDAARTIMFELTDKTDETSNLAVENDGFVVFLRQVESNNPIRAFFKPGSRGHMHSSGIGKVLMAHMSDYGVRRILRERGLPGYTPKTIVDEEQYRCDLTLIRERGWSYDDEERFIGMRCVAAPIFNAGDEAVAGISLSGPTARFRDDQISYMGNEVRTAAQKISDVLRGQAEL